MSWIVVLDCRRNRFLPSLHASFIALPHALSMYTLQFVSHGLAFMWCAKTFLVLCTYMHVYVIMHSADASLDGAAPGFCHVVCT